MVYSPVENEHHNDQGDIDLDKLLQEEIVGNTLATEDRNDLHCMTEYCRQTKKHRDDVSNKMSAENATKDDVIDLNIQESGQTQSMTRCKTLFTLLVMSFSFLLLFSAFVSFENLQSSLNHEDGLGTSGLAVLYGVYIVTSLFLTPVVMANISAKLTLVFAMSTFLLYLATGFYAKWTTVIPATVVVGVGAAHIWISQQDFIRILAKGYADVTGSAIDNVITMFMGIFFGIYGGARVLGNLFSSAIFSEDRNMFDRFSTNTSNTSLFVDDHHTSHCGSDFCSQTLTNNTTDLLRPQKHKVDMFTVTCLGLASFAVILSMTFLPRTPVRSSRGSSSKLVRSVVSHIIRSRDQQILIIPTIFRGLALSFLLGDVTIAFVSCPFGIENVGYVMTTQGVVCSIGSVIVGRLAKFTGWLPLFITAFIAQMSACIVLILWKPIPAQMFVVFVLVALISVGDVIYLLGLSTLHNVHFTTTTETAISCFWLCMGVGNLIAFAYSSHVCMRYKTYIIMGVATASIVCMLVFLRRRLGK